MSPETLEELAVVIRRKKFDRYVASAKRDEFLEALLDRAIFIEPNENIHECRDTKDNKF